MSKKESAKRFQVFVKAGLPFTILGMAVVFAGIYLIRAFLGDRSYSGALMFVWLAVFWFVYQPLFRRRILSVAARYDKR